MIPMRTLNNPTRRMPYLTYGLIVINLLVFIWETRMPQAELYRTFYALSAVPCEITSNFLSLQTGLGLFRSMFLHVSWLHLIGNMMYLWIFGSNVEDFFGHKWFIASYVVGGIAAALTQTLFYSNQCVPMVGASGAVFAVLGMYIILYPATKVRVAVLYLWPFVRTFAIPALVVIGLWFAEQVLTGIGSLVLGDTLSGGVATFAHIGGFIFGLLFAFVFTLFAPRPQQPVAV
jgi:rhomboid family protein